MVTVNQFGVNCRMISRKPVSGIAQEGRITAGVESEEDMAQGLYLVSE
jgi:hypothetical protein